MERKREGESEKERDVPVAFYSVRTIVDCERDVHTCIILVIYGNLIFPNLFQ